MISIEKFEQKLIWLVDVTGLAVRKSVVSALWDELKDTEASDFEQAVKAIAHTDEKINLANLSRHIAKYRMQRIEREAITRQSAEDQQMRLWFRRHTGSRGQCINDHECGQCKREYCDIVGRAATEAIKKMLLGEITGAEAHNRLASQFHGIGFERNVPGMEPF